MYSEVFFGLMPQFFERIQRFDSSTSGYWTFFVNRETGEFQSEDPRLGGLPKGWKRRDHKEKYVWSWFVNEETGEDAKSHEPRMLQSLRVKLEDFVLV